MRKRIKTLLAYLALAVFGAGLAACGNLVDRHYGPAETQATEAYQLEGRYVYLALAVDAYVHHAQADPSVVETLCVLDHSAHEAMQVAGQTLLATDDKALLGLKVAGVALRNLSLSVLDDFSLSATVEDVGQRTVVLATIAVEAVTKMRVFRKTFLEPQLEAFHLAGLDPGEQDFAVLGDKADGLHASIQAACN